MKHKQSDCFEPETCGGMCYGCTLAVCKVCGCSEASLTTECPEVQIRMDRQKEIYEDSTIDFTAEKGWHNNLEHKSIWDRVAQFEEKTT